MKKLISASIIISILVVATLAYAFSRDITGMWARPNGRRSAVVHHVSSGGLDISIPLDEGIQGVYTLDFSGDIADGFGGANSFQFDLTMTPLDLAKGKKTCHVRGTFGGDGLVLGQFPSRVLRMRSCDINIKVSCSGEGTKNLHEDCSGDWK